MKADSNSNEAVNDIDWESYLDNQAAAAPMPSYKSNNEELPSLEVDADRGTSLFDHLEWQLKLSHFTLRRRRHRDADHRQPDADGYLKEPLEDLAEEAGVTRGAGRAVLKRIQEFDPVGVGRAHRSRSAC